MCKIFAVTNSEICGGFENLKIKILRLCEAEISGIIYRDKALNSADYEKNFIEILKICKNFGVKLFLHNFYEIALKLNYPYIWLPLPTLKMCGAKNFKEIVASAHNVYEAKEALGFGATALCLSHIFKTSCKAELAPKGVNLIKNVREFFDGEIYALGGISPDDFNEILLAGTNNLCLMSSLMQIQNEKELLNKF